jgi:hypothetical protein
VLLCSFSSTEEKKTKNPERRKKLKQDKNTLVSKITSLANNENVHTQKHRTPPVMLGERMGNVALISDVLDTVCNRVGKVHALVARKVGQIHALCCAAIQ